MVPVKQRIGAQSLGLARGVNERRPARAVLPDLKPDSNRSPTLWHADASSSVVARWRSSEKASRKSPKGRDTRPHSAECRSHEHAAPRLARVAGGPTPPSARRTPRAAVRSPVHLRHEPEVSPRPLVAGGGIPGITRENTSEPPTAGVSLRGEDKSWAVRACSSPASRRSAVRTAHSGPIDVPDRAATEASMTGAASAVQTATGVPRRRRWPVYSTG
jgi:hypothetical protein